jgi:outer membrane lipoprotein-sorting protein
MKNRLAVLILNALLVCQCFASAYEPNDTLQKLNQSVKNIKNLSAAIEYIHSQPLFDTQTVRSGKLFYVKDANNSTLRINFLTIKQDDSANQKYREDYVFDGLKLTKIDYQSKSIATEQLGKDAPIEPFELVQDYFPIIGFSKPDELRQQFEIKLQQKTDKQKFITLILIPKENSGFFKIYKQVEVKIDSKSFLPFDFSGLTLEDEMITIKLSQMDTSTAVKRKVFDIVLPDDFVRTQK